jgi:hypothetical protein
VLSTPSETNAPPDAQVALTCTGCGDVTWQVSSDVSWIDTTIVDAQVRVHADPAGLGAGVHTGTITLTATERTDIAAITLPISFVIGNPETLFPRPLYMPAIVRH